MLRKLLKCKDHFLEVHGCQDNVVLIAKQKADLKLISAIIFLWSDGMSASLPCSGSWTPGRCCVCVGWPVGVAPTQSPQASVARSSPVEQSTESPSGPGTVAMTVAAAPSTEVKQIIT